MNHKKFLYWFGIIGLLAILSCGRPAPADLVLHSGKVVTVDEEFSVHEAVAVRKVGRVAKANIGIFGEVIAILERSKKEHARSKENQAPGKCKPPGSIALVFNHRALPHSTLSYVTLA